MSELNGGGARLVARVAGELDAYLSTLAALGIEVAEEPRFKGGRRGDGSCRAAMLRVDRAGRMTVWPFAGITWLQLWAVLEAAEQVWQWLSPDVSELGRAKGWIFNGTAYYTEMSAPE